MLSVEPIKERGVVFIDTSHCSKSMIREALAMYLEVNNTPLLVTTPIASNSKSLASEYLSRQLTNFRIESPTMIPEPHYGRREATPFEVEKRREYMKQAQSRRKHQTTCSKNRQKRKKKQKCKH